MFQMFACKQVVNAPAVLCNLSKQQIYSQLGKACPSCTLHTETAGHILSCQEIGWVTNLNRQLLLIQDWLQQVGTAHDLIDLITTFLVTRGTMIANNYTHYTPPSLF